MSRFSKRAVVGMVALATASTVAPLLAPSVASAEGIPSGAATVVPATGTSATNFTLTLPTNPACTGDSSLGGFRVQTYMVEGSVNPAELTFDAFGPVPNTIGAGFRQPLYTDTTAAAVDMSTADASTPGGPGPVINIPTFNIGNVFGPGDVPAGTYNVGVACTLGGPSATQLHQFWNTVLFVTDDPSGGPAQISWSNEAPEAAPSAPVLNSLTPDDGTLTAAFTPNPTDNPTAHEYVVTATPTGGGAAVTASGTGSPITVGTLTNGVEYSVTVRAVNTVDDSPESNALTGTPTPGVRPAVTGLVATPGTERVDLSWNAPAGPVPTGYDVQVSPAEGSVVVTGTTAAITGLTPGTVYTFTVTPQHPAPYVAAPATVSAAPVGAAVLIQDITVTRPAGALVLTQICGTRGPIPADELGTAGFPVGSLPADPGVTTGTAPTLTAGGTDEDPLFDEYPYPDDEDGLAIANYPTHCGIDLGAAKLIKSGPGAGQFFAASGFLNQVTVVETRDTDLGWTVNGIVSDFVAGPGRSFKGSQLGWTPQWAYDTPPFDDADPATPTYDQATEAGPRVDPNTIGGLGDGKVLFSANAGEGLGIAQVDARLKLLIPITARTGDYTATLTISAV
ncbi:MAG: fibronectin type III domain-containing protein [Acidimicrobiia bacterium]